VHDLAQAFDLVEPLADWPRTPILVKLEILAVILHPPAAHDALQSWLGYFIHAPPPSLVDLHFLIIPISAPMAKHDLANLLYLTTEL
jgi:hypothetical protein